MSGFLRMRFLPQSTDAGLLALRLIAGLSLFLKHGTEKLFGFSAMNAHFPGSNIHGISLLLLLATLSDGICSLLMMVGFATRWAALVSFINIFGAWSVIHHFAFFGRSGDHGELIVLYLAAFIALLISGPGRYSVDAKL
ncbi:MAG: DoxX family protein [Acidobacteriaceae bacterium]